MLASFLQVLLNALIDKSHNLLQEEIIQAVYSMVASNFDAYFAQFIPTFLMNLSGLTDHQKSQLHQNYKRHQVRQYDSRLMSYKLLFLCVYFECQASSGIYASNVMMCAK